MKAQLVVGILGWALATGAAQQTNLTSSLSATSLSRTSALAAGGDQALGAIGILSLGMISKAESVTISSRAKSETLSLTAGPRTEVIPDVQPTKRSLQWDHFAAEVYQAEGIRGLFELRKPIDADRYRQRVLAPQPTDRLGRGSMGIKLLSIGF